MAERGSISILAAALLGVLALGIVLLGQLGTEGVRRARAAAIADFVAMAAVASSVDAYGVATANNAHIISITGQSTKTVMIRHAGIVAQATAELVPLCIEALVNRQPQQAQRCD